MRQCPSGRVVRALAALGLAASLLVPAGTIVTAQDENILRAGTDQDLQVLNPWNSILVVDFEVYTLNYDLLVNFGQNLEPVPGFAESWESSADGLTWTFKIREGMQWSDGQPATAEDARWTYQLVLDAAASETTLGAGYLEPYLTNAGLKAVSAPDETTLVVETEFANTLLLQSYVPILPKHVWESVPVEEIASTYPNSPPVVGTGPYQAVEFEPGDFIRFQKNPNYWGTHGAAEEVIIQNFDSNETMVQALRNNEIDYARGIAADAFDALEGQADIVTVGGIANGYSYLTFNGWPDPIEGGGWRTRAVSDPAFRDALGWAIDHEVLVDRILAGHGTPGTTIVPPFHSRWHIDPPADVARRFDIDEAKRRLDAAGYALDSGGNRLDKEGNPITLRLTWPDSEEELATAAQFVQDWWGQLGIAVEAAVTEEGKLLEDLLPPPDGTANFDTYMWGWVGDPDPTSLLKVFLSSEIGASSDTFYQNPEYDRLFDEQIREPDEAKRKDLIGQMQTIFYRDAPNLVLYYDAELHAYRTDKFGGWTNQPPEGGTPLFGYGSGGYSYLTAAGEPASPSPAAPGGASSAPATPAASGTGSATSTAAGDSTPLLIAIAALVVVVGGGLLLARRRRASVEDE